MEEIAIRNGRAAEAAPTRRPSKWLRWWLRAPLLLYRVRLGRFSVGEYVLWLYGHPHIRVVHVGRRSGRQRQVVLEVIDFDADTDEYRVAAMWGPESDWYRNLRQCPTPEVEVRGRRFCPEQRFLSTDESQKVLDRYQARHWIWAWLGRAMIKRPSTGVAMPVVGFRRPPVRPSQRGTPVTSRANPGDTASVDADRRADRLLQWAVTFFAVAVLIHNSDHMRRGFDSVGRDVFIVGSSAIALEVGIVVLCYQRHRWAPLAAGVTGFSFAG